MASRHAVTALFAVQLIALAASAQQPAEFGRATGGEIVMTTKTPASLSGSLSAAWGDSPAYGITAGGTLVRDRLWFFAAGSRREMSRAQLGNIELPENATTGAIGARVNAHIGGGQDISASFDAGRQPSSFLALRYNSVVSSNLLFSASFMRSSRTVE